jgi:hypothetical protein
MEDNFDLRKFLKEQEINENNNLNTNYQKRFNMIVSKLKNAKSEKDLDIIHTDIVLLPKKVTNIFINKLIDMGLANREEDGKYSLSYDDGLDESRLNENKVNESENNYDFLIGRTVTIHDIMDGGDDEEMATIVKVEDTPSGSHKLSFEDGSDAILFHPREWEGFINGNMAVLHPDEVMIELN